MVEANDRSLMKGILLPSSPPMVHFGGGLTDRHSPVSSTPDGGLNSFDLLSNSSWIWVSMGLISIMNGKSSLPHLLLLLSLFLLLLLRYQC